MSTCPQYETKEPKRGTSYYTPNPSGTISKWTWRGQAYDYARLNHYNVYLKESDAKDRVRWNVEMVCRSPSISLTPLLDRATELLDAQKNAGRVASELAAAAMNQFNAQVAAATEKDCADDYADACMFAAITRPKEPTMSKFPQPEVVAPELGTTYFIADTAGNIVTCKWIHENWDLARLKNHRVYLTPGAASARHEWEQQEATKHTVPAWFRALGPRENIEYKNTANDWNPLFVSFAPPDWSLIPESNFRTKPDWFTELGPEVEIRNDNGVWIPYVRNEYRVDHNALHSNGVPFRAKRKHVVKEINGVRFSWPATVQLGDPKGPRHRIDYDDGSFTIASSVDWCNEFGPFVHETREGAIEQRRALIAMAQ